MIDFFIKTIRRRKLNDTIYSTDFCAETKPFKILEDGNHLHFKMFSHELSYTLKSTMLTIQPQLASLIT